MKYNYCTNVRDNDALRKSFNELTQKVFGFDFRDWYQRGHWGDKYIPHVLTDEYGKVISNVSVNLMKFDINGDIKNYIQLGTVMTNANYRGQGLNRYIMERILQEYQNKVDGIYLFGNDSVLNYYPKFSFKAVKEYEYSLHIHKPIEGEMDCKSKKYRLEKVIMSDETARHQLYRAIQTYDKVNRGHNPNDGFCMCDNLGLYQFWLSVCFYKNVYYIADLDSYVIADVQAGILKVYQIISTRVIDMDCLACSFEQEVTDIKLCYTPIQKEKYTMSLYKEEDCTLFILGDSLEKEEKEKMIVPIISHA